MVMRDNAAYLLDNGRIMVLWLGRNIPQPFLKQVSCWCHVFGITQSRTAKISLRPKGVITGGRGPRLA